MISEMNDRHEEEEIIFSDDTQTTSNVCATTGKSNRAALILIDFQNEFVKEGGKLHGDVAETMNNTGVLQNVPKLVEFARKMGALIIYSSVVTKKTRQFDDVDESSASSRKNEYDRQFGLFTENTWNCEIVHEVEPRNADIILTDRNDSSAFAGTKLLSCLKENNVNHFFVTGFLTDDCVYQTSMEATKLLPEMTTYIISDGCAAKTMDDHETALENISKKSVYIISSFDAESIFTECNASMKKCVLDGSDEWLTIEKIFSAAGVDENKSISVDKLQSLVGSLPSSSSILSILSENLGGMGDKPISRQDMHKILFERKPRKGFFDTLPIFIAMIYMPFVYSISTRIPFIFIALEITVARGRDLWEVGLILGVYQTSRAIGNLLVVVFGGKDPFKRLQILLIISALFGWNFLALYDRDAETTSLFSFERYKGDGEGNIKALFALFWVGLCETIVILQRALMTETANESPSGIIDETILSKRFSLQYSMVSLGSAVAYVFGGWLYTEYGYFAVCDFGILIQIAHLFGAMAYLTSAKKSTRELKDDELGGNDLIRSVIYQFQSVSVIAKYARDIANGTENALSSEASGLSAAAMKTKSDRVLNHSLSQMFQHFFAGKMDDIASMEELLESIDKTETRVSLKSRRPSVMAIGKNKLSKLALYLMKSKGEGSLTEAEFVSFWAPRVYLSMFESSQASSISVTWPYMKAVVLTQSIAALCIGIFLSTSLLSYTERFDIDAARVGLLLGIGEGLGMLTIFVKSFSSTNRVFSQNSGIMATITSRPLHVPFVLVLASACTMLFSIDNYILAMLCQMVLSSVNDLSVSLMNELIGTSLPADKFKFYQGTGQWLRRLGNMITAILGPILFGIDPKLPFVFFGAIVFIWVFFLWFLMYKHASRIQWSIAVNSGVDGKADRAEDSKSCFANSILGEPFVPFMETTQTPWHELEQKYYALNKELLEDELGEWENARVDISLMEHRIRRIAAALEVEKDQRRALEDRMYARVSCSEMLEDESKSLV